MPIKRSASFGKGYFLFLVIGLSITFLLILWVCLSTTYHVEAASPDGKMMVRVTATSQLGGLVLPLLKRGTGPDVVVDLIDNTTKGRRRVEQFQQGGLVADWDHPRQVVWTPDSKQFSVISSHTEEPNFTAVVTYTRVFRVTTGSSDAQFKRLDINPVQKF